MKLVNIGLNFSTNHCSFSPSLFSLSVTVALLAVLVYGGLVLQEEDPRHKIFVERPFDSNASLGHFQESFATLRRDFPGQDRRTWAVVGAAVKAVIRTDEEPSQPAVIMLVHSSEEEKRTAECLAKKLSSAATSALNLATSLSSPSPDDDALSGSSFSDRSALHDRMMSDLASSGTLVLEDLENVSGSAAMALHSVCDNINAPYKRAVIVLLLGTDDGQVERDNGGRLGEVIESALEDAWSGDLDVDKLSPLLSRITVSAARVKAEESVKC